MKKAWGCWQTLSLGIDTLPWASKEPVQVPQDAVEEQLLGRIEFHHGNEDVLPALHGDVLGPGRLLGYLLWPWEKISDQGVFANRVPWWVWNNMP